MKSRAPILITTICATLAAAVFFQAWRVRATARDTEARHSELATQNAALKDRLHALNPQIKKPDNSPKTQAAHKANLATMSKIDAGFALERQRQNTTEFQKKRLAAVRVHLGIAYGPFYHMAGLTPDQAAQLTDALSQRLETRDDINAVQRTQRGKQSDPVWGELRNEANAKAQAAAQAILGDAAHAQFQLYERQIGAWAYAEKFAAGMSLADMPVSLGQTQKLVEAMTKASPSYQNGTAPQGVLPDIDWNAVDAAAQKILTPEQFEFFTTIYFMSGATLDNVGVLSRWDQEYHKAFDAATKPAPPEPK